MKSLNELKLIAAKYAKILTLEIAVMNFEEDLTDYEWSTVSLLSCVYYNYLMGVWDEEQTKTEQHKRFRQVEIMKCGDVKT